MGGLGINSLGHYQCLYVQRIQQARKTRQLVFDGKHSHPTYTRLYPLFYIAKGKFFRTQIGFQNMVVQIQKS